MVTRKVGQLLGRESARFGSKEEPTVLEQRGFKNRGLSLGGHGKASLGRRALNGQKLIPTAVDLKETLLVVIQAGSSHLGAVDGKSEGANQVELCSCVGTESNDIACIGWNLRLDQDDLQAGGRGRGLGMMCG